MALAHALLLAEATAGPRTLPLVFWQAQDVREPHDVTFEAHPFSPDRARVLLAPDEKHDSLWYMPTDVLRVGQDVRIYYQRVEKKLPHTADQRTWCVGVLRGRDFLLPDLRAFPTPWGGPANVVLQRSPHTPTWGGFNVFQIASDADGYRLLYWDQPAQGDAGALLATSDDGLHWTKDEQRAVFTEHNDAFTLVRDPRSGEYLLYQTRLEDWPDKPYVDNLPGKRRVIALRRSKDLKSWTPQETILRPDEQDAPETEFYLLKVFRCAGRFVGLVMKYYADPEKPNQHSAILRHELIFSDDGVRWARPYRGTDMGAWSYVDPFEHDGKWWLAAHHERKLVLLESRKNGLASCGTKGTGSFCTPPFNMPPTPLLLNADSREGLIEVEVLDGDGREIEVFDRGACGWIGDGEALRLSWHSDTAALAGRPVHLRFHLRNARIYGLSSADMKP